ncbi:hypothetical protein [Nocardiopsis sp. NPDC006938]|uniref:hypothetical protein n=1 Tax=Nocardiopsis sp. NPDC006938 TaxID=3364337 RepID=UPI003694948E
MSRVPTFLALTGFNLRHLLLSPVFLALVPATLVVLASSSYYPALPTWKDLISQVRIQIVGMSAVMFAVTTFPALREVRYSEGFAPPLTARARLVSVLLASVLVTSVCAGLLIAHLALRGPEPIAGTASPFAVAALVVLSWCGPIGALVSAVWTRSYTPLVLLLLLIPAYLLYTVTSMGARAEELLRRLNELARWLLDPLPVDEPSVTRLGVVSLLHVVFLAALLLTVALARKRNTRLVRPASVGVAALLLAGMVSVDVHAQRSYTYETPFTDHEVYGAEADPCRVREGVTYCPLPGYDSWVDYWHAALAPTVERIPERARDSMPTVWQGSQHLRRDVREFQPGALEFPRTDEPFPPRGTVLLFDSWEPGARYHHDDLVSDFTTNVLGLPRLYDPWCEASGQARIVVGAWLVSGAGKIPAAESRWAVEAFLPRFRPSPLDLRLTRTLLELPPEDVATVVDEHWETLVSADTPTEELAELLELPLTGDGAVPGPDWEADSWYGPPLPPDGDWRGPVCR